MAKINIVDHELQQIACAELLRRAGFKDRQDVLPASIKIGCDPNAYLTVERRARQMVNSRENHRKYGKGDFTK